MKKFKLIIAIALLSVVAATIALTGCTNNTNNDSAPLTLEETFLPSSDEWGHPYYATRSATAIKPITVDTFDVSTLRTGTSSEGFAYIRLFFNYDNVKSKHYNKVKMSVTTTKDAKIRLCLQDRYYSEPETIFCAQTVTFQAGVQQKLEFEFTQPIDFKKYNYIRIPDEHLYLYDFSLHFDWTIGTMSYKNWPEFIISDFEILEAGA